MQYQSFILVLLLISIEFHSSNAGQKRSYTSGIADMVRSVFQRGVTRFPHHQTGYSSDVFRYTQHGYDGGLLAGESCRLSSTLCSYDEQCCSGRCLCRRWSIMGEERCIRKCF